MLEIVLATHNVHKIREIKEILGEMPFHFLSLDDDPTLPDVNEDGMSLEENALKKAAVISKHTGLPALADDTGLEVFSLGLQPGVLSARYAGEHVTYAENNAKLLKELNGKTASERKARFRCVAALVGDGVEKLAVGICHGTIIDVPRGREGFGYDPLFLPDGYERTFAELAPEIKNDISHRAKAFRHMKKILLEFVPAV